MTNFYEFSGYTQKINEDATCTCRWSTIHPENYKEGLKICRHLKLALEWHKMKMTPKKITLLRELVDFICESCGKHEKYVGKLQPHRITRGNVSGKYNLRNIKMICSNCHKIIHSNEIGVTK